MGFFKNLCVLVLMTKVTSALEGIIIQYTQAMNPMSKTVLPLFRQFLLFLGEYGAMRIGATRGSRGRSGGFPVRMGPVGHRGFWVPPRLFWLVGGLRGEAQGWYPRSRGLTVNTTNYRSPEVKR